jgi:hypothetical protein
MIAIDMVHGGSAFQALDWNSRMIVAEKQVGLESAKVRASKN